MIDQQSVIGIITARGGSKQLPHKNTRELCGKPLIAWSIEASLQSRCLDELVVSTDSDDIAVVARQYGANVPFKRPAKLATDEARSVDVIEHAIEHYRTHGREFDYVVLIEPTSPLREPGDIDAALGQLVEAGADSIVSVCRADTVHPAFMFRKTAGGTLQAMLGTSPTTRRQDTEALYYLEGTIYASRVSTLLKTRSFCHDNTVAYEVPKWKSPEIDDIVDFLLVEAIMRHRGMAT